MKNRKNFCCQHRHVVLLSWSFQESQFHIFFHYFLQKAKKAKIFSERKSPKKMRCTFPLLEFFVCQTCFLGARRRYRPEILP